MNLVYRYGLLAPTDGAEKVNEQISLAHRYRNLLVEFERARRAEVNKAIMTDAVQELDELIAEAEDQEDRTKLHAERKALIKERRATPAVAEAIKVANETHRAKIREARGKCGVYWGTYLIVEAAAEQASKSFDEPRFARWTGEGAVAVQLQGGLAAEDSSGTPDTRFQLILAPTPVPGRGGKPLPRVRLRVGSDGRDPIWAEWPLIYHRPLPLGAVIKWAKVVRRKAASRDVWSLHLTIETQEAQCATTNKPVAVDLGWRHAEVNGAETTRAGGWHDGAKGGDIYMDPAVGDMLRKAEDIRSIRDKHQNTLHACLLTWIKTTELPSDEHKERFQNLPFWKSPNRFAGLALWWRENRFAGDGDMFQMLEAWRKRDKHLWLYEAGVRSRALLRRREQYRIFAAQMAREYDTLIIERLNLSKLAEIPAPDDERESHPKARKQRVDTAPSELRGALVNAFRATTIIDVKPTGPAKALYDLWREGHGEARKAGPARSERFNRLRKIKPVDATEIEKESEALANVVIED